MPIWVKKNVATPPLRLIAARLEQHAAAGYDM